MSSSGRSAKVFFWKQWSLCLEALLQKPSGETQGVGRARVEEQEQSENVTSRSWPRAPLGAHPHASTEYSLRGSACCEGCPLLPSESLRRVHQKGGFSTLPQSMRGRSYAPTLRSSPTWNPESLPWPHVPTQLAPCLCHSSSPIRTSALHHTGFPALLKPQAQSGLNTCLCTRVSPAGACAPRCPYGPLLHFLWSLLKCHLRKASPDLPSSNCTLSLSISSLCLNFLHSANHYLMSKYDFQRVKNMTLTQASSGVCQ